MTTSLLAPPVVQPDWRWITRHPVYFVAFGCGTGLSPIAPGTVGTLLGYPLYFALVTPFSLPDSVVIFILASAFIFGIFICDYAGKAVGVADHPGIVWDEIVAMSMVLYCIPDGYGWWGAGFIAFRVFDITKPWPINWVDRHWHHGFGVMFDDLLAAGYAVVTIQTLHWLMSIWR